MVVVQFDGDKLAHEHLYSDQASVLVRLGPCRPEGCRSSGPRARSVLDRRRRLKALIRRAKAR